MEVDSCLILLLTVSALLVRLHVDSDEFVATVLTGMLWFHLLDLSPNIVLGYPLEFLLNPTFVCAMDFSFKTSRVELCFAATS